MTEAGVITVYNDSHRCVTAPCMDTFIPTKDKPGGVSYLSVQWQWWSCLLGKDGETSFSFVICDSISHSRAKMGAPLEVCVLLSKLLVKNKQKKLIKTQQVIITIVYLRVVRWQWFLIWSITGLVIQTCDLRYRSKTKDWHFLARHII